MCDQKLKKKKMVKMSWFCNIWSCSTWNSRKKYNNSKNRKKKNRENAVVSQYLVIFNFDFPEKNSIIQNKLKIREICRGFAIFGL